jgi:hypothetical protein
MVATTAGSLFPPYVLERGGGTCPVSAHCPRAERKAIEKAAVTVAAAIAGWPLNVRQTGNALSSFVSAAAVQRTSSRRASRRDHGPTQGAKPGPGGNESLPRLCVYPNVVNRSAQELFPVIIMLREAFILTCKKSVALSM